MTQNEKEWPKRKHPRLKHYDYSRNGIYFVTISAKDQFPIFSKISAATHDPVGRGLAPAEVKILLSPIGKIAEEQLLSLEKRYPYITVDKYVIMPTHIHVILIFHDGITARASPRPTVCADSISNRDDLSDVMCVYKSLTTRQCKQQGLCATKQLFQASFYEEILKTQEAYIETRNYIAKNPLRWFYKNQT
ncbi:MAG: hypothetical protein IJY22_08130 [Clostridia bacterium]|nr:hypothetical protein [Clostridia bacterium]